MVHADASNESPFAAGLRRASLYTLLVGTILGLAAVAWAINDAISDHHDRIALKGLNGKPSPVAVTVGTTSGWVAAEYLQGAPVSGSGVGNTNPAQPFRVFIPLIGSDNTM